MLFAYLTALLAGLATPDPCVHAFDAPRPRLTHAEQAATRRLIRVAVDELGGSKDFAALLVLVATRESSLQRGVVHRLPADLDANASALRKLRSRYVGNPWIDNADRWQGYGLFGFNAAIFTQVWDSQADPRVLCDAVVDVLVYQRAVARTVAKMRRTGACAPTWANIHAAVSGGKFCPASTSADFRRRAHRIGLDPDWEVAKGDLGRLATHAHQQAELARVRLVVNVRPAEAS